MGVTWYVGAATVMIVVETVLIVWLLRHRAAGSRAQRLLKERLRFETLLADLSAKLIHVEARRLDAALGGALQQAVSFLGMDRGNLDEYADGVSVARISWTEPGMQPLPSILAGGHLSWTMDTLQRGGIVRFSRLRDLPAAASADRASYERLGTRSHLSIPLRVGGPLLGVLSFDSVRAERDWPEELVDRLWLLSEAFASALERKRMELSLADRLRFHRLLSHLSARFGNVAVVALDREIHNALRGIVDFSGVDRATLVEFLAGGRGRSWATDKPMDPERWPWLITRVRGGDEVRMSRIEELPDEAAVDRRNAVALGRISQVAVPLRAGGSVLGAVVLATDSPAREWPDAFMEQLRLLCEVIANALAAAKAERESGRLRQELAHIGRVSALGELTASLAHELSQPLTAILNNAEVAQHHLEADVIQVAKLRDILDDIVADDKRAAGVIRRLRTMLKKGDLEHVALSVNDVVREVIDLVRNDTILRDIPVHLDLAADLPPVRGDRAQLQQVVLNMVLNGLEATSASDGRAYGLVIRTSGAGGKEVVVAVEDSGMGIDMEDLDRLFQPLYTTKAEGLGMGLAIARTIVSAHGGQLRASNKAGGGAIFEFTLPAYAESATS
jgi:signal transduction histidine kinase